MTWRTARTTRRLYLQNSSCGYIFTSCLFFVVLTSCLLRFYIKDVFKSYIFENSRRGYVFASCLSLVISQVCFERQSRPKVKNSSMYHDKVASHFFFIVSSCLVAFVQYSVYFVMVCFVQHEVSLYSSRPLLCSIRSLLLLLCVCSTRSLLCSIGSVLKETR